ncbi:MAG: hypothetical protein KJ904_14940 [Alphaproteobacteria bacterium]|nr:hypothetical protein [Alphaproteobacteria bacterium]MBU0796201.1 hypothetical protein [Alphaproteobacteria bacterium]MBU0888451.1 hypothetical protein [Alphaproteobacteria bacterium]MBU1813086.1 hypothetical protein [Alphaproteobacteria bacterium]MBU2090228.1 hypothetical protein [Alphaproteobacteria bacterium]
MFSATKKKDPEAEQRLIDAMKARCEAQKAQLAAMTEKADTSGAERAAARLMELAKNPKLPNDYKKFIMGEAQRLECEANIKATDAAVHRAMAAAMADNKEQRDKEIVALRKTMQKAVSLRAPQEFRLGTEKALENILLSGGVRHDGPTKAKPMDTAPKLERSAKDGLPVMGRIPQDAKE